MTAVVAMMEREAHVPVLRDEVLDWLRPAPGHHVLDGTVGAGGHAAALLERIRPDGELHGIDRDPQALELARDALVATGGAFLLHRGRFDEVRQLVPPLVLARGFDAILLDLGVSSMQLDAADRGFSFREDGPLDMRMDPASPLTAAELVAELDEAELAHLIAEYGEDRAARRIARAIVRERALAPLDTTARLAEVVRRAAGRGAARYRIDPATRTFQALRIAVNGELDGLEGRFSDLAHLLVPGGRMAVICFHSLEDRAAKTAFRELAASGAFRLPFRKPLVAGAEEQAINRRSRSAKLRVIERRAEEDLA